MLSNVAAGFGRWVNLKAIKRLVEADALKMEIIPNPKVTMHYYCPMIWEELNKQLTCATYNFRKWMELKFFSWKQQLVQQSGY